MNNEKNQKHIETIAKMYAEQILATSMQMADAIVRSAIEHAGNISNNANQMSQAVSTEAIKKAVNRAKARLEKDNYLED